jgi:DNA mismatch endonuclease, patch repair protein
MGPWSREVVNERRAPKAYESWASSDAVRRSMSANHRVDTAPEIVLRSALHRRGHRFRKDLPITLAGRRVRPDIVFSRAHVAVFVDGCFWHRCPEHGSDPKTNAAYWAAKLDQNVTRDCEVDALLVAGGWSVVRVWEHDVIADVDRAVMRVESAMRACSTRDRG